MYVVAALIIEVISGLSRLKKPFPDRGLAVDRMVMSISCLSFSKLSSASLQSSLGGFSTMASRILSIVSWAVDRKSKVAQD